MVSATGSANPVVIAGIEPSCACWFASRALVIYHEQILSYQKTTTYSESCSILLSALSAPPPLLRYAW